MASNENPPKALRIMIPPLLRSTDLRRLSQILIPPKQSIRPEVYVGRRSRSVDVRVSALTVAALPRMGQLKGTF